jgi:tetratricopeptide (TPR) repeat protein
MLGTLAVALMLERQYNEALKVFYALTKYSTQTKHKVGQFWGLTGLLKCLLELHQTDKAAAVLAELEKAFPSCPSAYEEVLYQAYKATLLFEQSKMDESMKMAELALDSMRTTSNDVVFYAIPAYADTTELILQLWEGML